MKSEEGGGGRGEVRGWRQKGEGEMPKVKG